MTAIQIDFSWYRDSKGYRLKDGRVVRNGGDLETYRPLRDFPTLFKIFAEKCRREEGVVDFIKTFGQLSTSRTW